MPDARRGAHDQGVGRRTRCRPTRMRAAPGRRSPVCKPESRDAARRLEQFRGQPRGDHRQVRFTLTPPPVALRPVEGIESGARRRATQERPGCRGAIEHERACARRLYKSCLPRGDRRDGRATTIRATTASASHSIQAG